MADGWIKLHRILIEKSIWECSTPEQKTILITILLSASHKEKEWEWKGERYKIQPGQFITSYEKLTKKCGKKITIQKLRTALDRFQKYEFLTYETTNKSTLVTIMNWEEYQGKEENQHSGQQPDNNQITNNQQSNNNQITTIKNDKNIKNVKKEKKGGKKFTPPSLDEVRIYCQERNNGVDAERFINFYESKGWFVGKNKMKCWKASVRTWEKPKTNNNSGGNPAYKEY